MKKVSVMQRAQILCDRERRKIPHLVWFIGDIPCADCIKKARGKKGGG